MSTRIPSSKQTEGFSGSAFSPIHQAPRVIDAALQSLSALREKSSSHQTPEALVARTRKNQVINNVAKFLEDQDADRLRAKKAARLQADEVARLQADEAARLQLNGAARLQADLLAYEATRLRADKAALLQAEQTARFQAAQAAYCQPRSPFSDSSFSNRESSSHSPEPQKI